MWLKCWTQEEIAEESAISERNVYKLIEECKKRIAMEKVQFDAKKDGNFCGMSKSAYNEVLQYLEFQQETDLSALSEKAAKLLIREQDEEVREEAIVSVEKLLDLPKDSDTGRFKKKLTLLMEE